MMVPSFGASHLRSEFRALGSCVFVGQLYGQAFAALLAATAQNSASPLRFHARAESVLPDAALVPGTIGWLTHGS